jgi:hypothetical protein
VPVPPDAALFTAAKIMPKPAGWEHAAGREIPAIGAAPRGG